MKKNKLVIVLLINIFILDIQLKIKKFKNIIASYCKKYGEMDIKLYGDYTEEEQIKLQENLNIIMMAIEEASELYPFNAKCLHRALIGYKYFNYKKCLNTIY